MNELELIKQLLGEALILVEEHGQAMVSMNKAAYSSGGTSSTAGMAVQLGSPAADVILTDAGPKKKRLEKEVPPPPPVPDSNVQGIKTTANGKRLKVTGLSPKDTDAYTFGKPNPRQPNLDKK